MINYKDENTLTMLRNLFPGPEYNSLMNLKSDIRELYVYHRIGTHVRTHIKPVSCRNDLDYVFLGYMIMYFYKN
jgi:hypothetical protein